VRETDNSFAFDFSLEAFEKAGVAPEKSRRIGGFVSTADLDKQGERLLQEGLDFSPFLQDGWFNDNHSKATADIVGFPETAKLIRKGERLPSGSHADKTGWFVEGYLLQGHPPSDKLWELANALQKTPRRLGFSVEGRVTQRMSKAGDPVIAKAVVRNVAITNCPVNNKTALEVLAKSLAAADMSKALEVGAPCGPASDPGLVPAGVPLSGIGAGRVLMPESIEGYQPPKKKRSKKRKLTKSEALGMIRARYPGITTTTATRILRFAVKQAAR
jgi:hypothetical protein